jgi:hypothetical protein
MSIGTTYDVSRTGSVSVLMYTKHELLFLRMEIEQYFKNVVFT